MKSFHRRPTFTKFLLRFVVLVGLLQCQNTFLKNAATAFTFSPTLVRRTVPLTAFKNHHRGTTTTTTTVTKSSRSRTITHLYMSSSSSSSSSYYDKTTFILSFDGTVSNTARSNARLAIDVALQTWPFLSLDLSFVCSYSEEDESLDFTWLINKMEALAHVTTEGIDKDYKNTLGLTVDDVLLARLLIEEQILDGGRSTGSGKYGSKYHPSSDSAAAEEEGSRGRKRRNNGSRPLTVGEISANWVDGGCLRDTARVKYNVDGKDPFPVIQEYLLQVQSSQPIPKIRPSIVDALTTSISRRQDQRQKQLQEEEEPQMDPIAYILVNHESQKSIVYKSLSKALPYDTRIYIANEVNEEEEEENNDNEGDDDDYDDDYSSYDVIITSPNNNKEQTSSKTTWNVIQNIVQNELKSQSTVYVVHSSIHTLRQSKHLFGDDSPRFQNGVGKSVFGNNIQLSLLLPTWADNVVHSQQISATMDPWIYTCSEEELCELITATIVNS